MNAKTQTWLALIVSLPTQNATARMRVWRALKGLGCAILRDGVYLIPDGPGREDSLLALAGETTEAGGSAHLLKLDSRDNRQDKDFRALFDRTADYTALAGEIAVFKTALPGQDAATVRKEIRNLRRVFRTIEDMDFFPGKARKHTESALALAEAAANAIISPDEPQPTDADISHLDPAAYRNRLWATRREPWVDRLASAWLIQRFIDPRARFLWLNSPRDCPPKALGFDFDGAAFTHVGNRVTFEVLLASFGLEGNAALARIGALVHYLDVGGIPVPEASGLETILRGAKHRCDSDDVLLAEASQIFDDLYAAHTHEDK
jgi:hypothetical protein